MEPVEQRLRTALRARAESTPQSEHRSLPLSRPANPGRPAVRVVAMICVCLVLLCVGGLIAVGRLRPNSDRQSTAPAQPPPVGNGTPGTTGVLNPSVLGASVPLTTTEQPPSTEEPPTTQTSSDRSAVDTMDRWPEPPADAYPDLSRVPTLLPTIPVLNASAATRSEQADEVALVPRYIQTWVGPDSNATLTITTYPHQTSATPGPSREPVGPIGSWDDSFVGLSTPDVVALSLTDPSGLVEVWTNSLPRDQVLEFASSLARRAAGSPGWDVRTSNTGLIPMYEGWSVGSAYRVVFWTSDGPVGEMSIVSGAPDLFASSWGHRTLAEVRTSSALAAESDGLASVIWSPQPNIVVRLGIYGSLEQALAIARSVEFADAAAWESASKPGPPVYDTCMFC